MITVNLKPGQKRKRAGTNPFKGMLDNFRGLGSKVKDPLLMAAVGGWICVVAGLGFIYLNTVRQLYSRIYSSPRWHGSANNKGWAPASTSPGSKTNCSAWIRPPSRSA